MSRLIAFRMPDDLAEVFERYCSHRKITLTEGMLRCVRDGMSRLTPTGRELAVAKFEAETRQTLKHRLAAIDALTGEPLEPRKPYQKGKRK